MKRTGRVFAGLWVVCVVTGGIALSQERVGVVPKEGFVPNEATAIAIAVAVWKPIYGEKVLTGKTPFTAKCEQGVWVVTGALPKGWRGGVPSARIRKINGEILEIRHTK